MKRWRPWLLGISACLVTIMAGRWGVGLFTTSEFVHFSTNFPTEPGFAQMPRAALASPWRRLPAEQWTGFPRGGLLVWGREDRATIDVGRQGILKDLIQPWTVLISSHWLRNVGTRPYRIQLELEPCGMPVQWATFERDWDEVSRSTTRQIMPGSTFNMDWIIDVPSELRQREIICETDLRIYDFETREVLTRFPISIVNSRRHHPDGPS